MHRLKTTVALLITIATLVALPVMCGYQIISGIHDAWVYRNEPVYLVPHAYNPIWNGDPPASVVCYSPARCEPSGHYEWRYFDIVGEHELRNNWHINPQGEIPFTG